MLSLLYGFQYVVLGLKKESWIASIENVRWFRRINYWWSTLWRFKAEELKSDGF